MIEDGNTSPLKEKSPMKESIRSGMLSKERLSLDEIEKVREIQFVVHTFYISFIAF